MNRTNIEWTHRPGTDGMTWNPIHAHSERLNERGTLKTGNFCTKISPGCANCYASRINVARGNGLEYTVPNLEKAKFYIDEKELAEPLKRKKPATIFVGDMFDLFHEAIPQEFIAEVLRVAWKMPRHTFQFLTKHADRMQRIVTGMMEKWGEPGQELPAWMWFGVSVESQKYADERIPLLLQTPAAIRFLSVEPLLEAIDLTRIPTHEEWRNLDALRGIYVDGKGWERNTCTDSAPISWVICGGESGPGARPFNLAWAESLRDQCKAAGVPFFMKQMGSQPFSSPTAKYYPMPAATRDRKGGCMAEWPESLRIREFPA